VLFFVIYEFRLSRDEGKPRSIDVRPGRWSLDDKTIGIYDTGAAGFAAEWEDEQDPPDDLWAALDTYFRPSATADIGCGSGRDSA